MKAGLIVLEAIVGDKLSSRVLGHSCDCDGRLLGFFCLGELLLVVGVADP